MQIGGTDLTITAKAIRDLTAEGCLGGPIGCRDYVEAEVTRGKVSQQITLYTPQTEVQREQNVHRAKVFGYEITLIALQKKQVVLNIEK